ncbi:flagellar protein FlhE [Vreelandella aquamarina]|uniref:flagellar protein FlhE n=1 Tax=Vreelandella aquamarina TaxID=77097 RepID=UPI001CC55DFA|nr:flagellar protein FlhE [Halomonas aquamarina]
MVAFIGAAQAAGSWSAQVPGMMVAMSDRESVSQPATPPAEASIGGGVIDRVHWRLDVPPGEGVNAWLCHPQQCVALSGMRGTVTALAGRQADAPLRFRFALRPGQRPVRVQGLQVIVNYQ